MNFGGGAFLWEKLILDILEVLEVLEWLLG
jgi:hypothetical protein